MTAVQLQRPVGQLLRQWRERRRLSQLELSIQAGISTRHLSFVETGRSAPSRDMVLHLAEQLELPLRERNHLLLAAGFAPVYAETAWDDPQLEAVRAMVRQVLTAHEPYPAAVVDRAWNLVDANASVALLTEGVAPELLAPPANVLRVSLHPDGMAGRIANLGEWRAHLLGRLRRQVALSGDPGLAQLYDELRAYPCDQPEPKVDLPGPGELAATLRVRHRGRELAFFSTVATFGAPLDVTIAELAIESFFPADPDTAALLRESSSGSQAATTRAEH
jgi:transcriptional regulator with XRE-family HTH domain